MDFHQLDFYEFEEKEFIENNFFVENYQHFPCSLILRLKVETRKDLFAFAYELLEKQKPVDYDSINFFNASGIVETISDMSLDYAPKIEWRAKEYWHYLHRDELCKKALFNGTKLRKKKKKIWEREMACVLYYDLKEEKQQRQQKDQ